MTRPLFEVGEVVLLRSESSPHLNGEYSIALVTEAGVSFQDPHKGVSVRDTGAGFGYVLDDPNLEIRAKTGEIVSIIWAQSALRKKHQPGEQSFRDLMQSLKQGQPA